MPLTDQQLLAIEVSERSMSVLSLLGSLFIVVTFISFDYFRKPINRLVFFATFGNVAANIATLISVSATKSVKTNGPSSLCKMQGVFIQWFLMADSLWIFAMALNVWLTFKRNYDASKLRSLEKYYLLFCYGIPFLPAFIYLILDSTGHHGIYGDATLWCWVSVKYDWMRIAFFYAPVWVVICITTAIYTVVGTEIFKKKQTLKIISKAQPAVHAANPVANPFGFNQENIQVSTKIEVTHDIIDEGAPTTPHSDTLNDSRSSFGSTRNLSNKAHRVYDKDKSHNQIIHISAGSSGSDTIDEETGNRVSSSTQSGQHRRHPAGAANNAAAWGYAKVAFLMFAALFIVWVPSTVNRAYSLAHRSNPSFPLNLLSALVLPLQGFWNATVYISTTWTQCKRAFSEIKYRLQGKGSPRLPKRSIRTPPNSAFDLAAHAQRRRGERHSESSEELDLGSALRMNNINTGSKEAKFPSSPSNSTGHYPQTSLSATKSKSTFSH